jgi:uncharacterized Zn finger protein
MAYDPYGWRSYVPVTQRRAQARREMARLRKTGVDVQPVEPRRGRKLATSFWGQAWCDHIEKFSDFANRLPRGRTYVRNGSVCHLEVREGAVQAIVSGSELYEVEVGIDPLPQRKWQAVKRRCAGRIGSLLELLSGRLDASVMKVVTDRDDGLFPAPREIHLACDCPDWAKLCKHLAAVLYGIGARLDERPELLFRLRGVDHQELAQVDAGSMTRKRGTRRRLADTDLSDVFGVEIDQAPPPSKPKPFRPIGKSVAALRKKLALSKTEFARLLGVSPASIANWERTRGRLNLQQRSIRALEAAMELGRDDARARLLREKASPGVADA